MYIDKKSEFDFNENYSIWLKLSRYSTYFEFNYLINKFEEVIYYISKLLNKDIKNINNEDYYNIVKSIFNIMFYEEDIFHLLSQATNEKYSKIENLKTRKIYKLPEREGRGRDFNYWTETYQRILCLIVPDDIKIDSNHNYSNCEIKELLKNHEIFLFKDDLKHLGIDPTLPFDVENLNVKIKTLTIEKNENNEYNYSEFYLDDIKCSDEQLYQKIRKLALQNIRENLYPKKVLKYAKQIIKYTEEFKNDFEKEIINSKFLNEEQKEELLQRVKKLINLHDNNVLQINKENEESSNDKILTFKKNNYIM